MTAIFELFAMVGALVMVAFGHILGRRDNMCIGTGLIAIGSVIQSTSFGVPQLLIGRIVGGLGLGIFTAQSPTWQAETTRREIRGRVIGSSLSFLCLGLVIAYFLDYGMAKYAGSVSRRFPFAFQAVLATGNIVCARFMPESPRYLLLKGRIDDARMTLAALRDLPEDAPEVVNEINEIQVAIDLEHENKKGFRDLFRADDNVRSRRRMLTAAVIQCCQPFSGSTVISFYVVTIFQDSVGLDPNLASLMSGFLQIWFLVASVGTWWLIEHVGRRRMFMISAALMTVDMAILAAMVAVGTHATGIVAAICIFLYESFYTWGWMAAVWMYNTEIQTLQYRTLGSGIGASCQWLFNFIMVLVVPPAFANIGWKTYIIFAVFNASFIPFIYFVVPEVSRVSLSSAMREEGRLTSDRPPDFPSRVSIGASPQGLILSRRQTGCAP
jgi:sugar porter (SP) family MFS transporter